MNIYRFHPNICQYASGLVPYKLYFRFMEDTLLNFLKGYVTARRRDLFKTIAARRTKHFCVAVEDVGHLHNTSAVIRSCDAFGVQNVHVVEEQYGKRIDREIAMGAQKWTSIYRYNKVAESIEQLKNSGYRIVATSPHKKAHTLENFDIEKPAAIFFGSEAKGLSKEVLQAADDFIYIPTHGFTESLNISVSAAIILQQLMHRLRQTSINWQLSEKEQEDLQLQWLQKHIKNSEELTERFYGK